MHHFGNIVINQKASDDYRAFLYWRDENNDCWEIRGYGLTAGKAADDAYSRYEQDREFHSNFYPESS